MFSINSNLCIDCGRCVSACPVRIFYREESGALAVKPSGCLECFQCSAACPTGAIVHDRLGSETSLPLPTDDSLLSKIQRRRSIRKFKPDAPDRAVIQAALEGAAYAPSARNDRAYQWTVILGKEKVDEFYHMILDWAAGVPGFLSPHGNNTITCYAPCLVLVHSPETCARPLTDGVIVTTVAEQLLNEAGLGTCWGGIFERAANQCAALREALSLPEGHRVHAVLMVGYPDERYDRLPFRPAAGVNWIE